MVNRPVVESQVSKRTRQGEYVLAIACVTCKQPQTLSLSGPEMYRLQIDSESLIQDILPNHTPAERELFISGICGACFDRMFGDDGDDGE